MENVKIDNSKKLIIGINKIIENIAFDSKEIEEKKKAIKNKYDNINKNNSKKDDII